MNSMLSSFHSREKSYSPFISDQQFDRLYPASLQALSLRHWTPLAVAREVAKFLVTTSGARILDIGSGAGKFCIAAAHFQPNGFYTGVEQRSNLVAYANDIKDQLQLDNVNFFHGNFTQLDFSNFDHFYFYNSFYENLAGVEKIDQEFDYSLGLYNYYNRYLYQLLDQKPAGTRLVTFHSLEGEVPPRYQVAYSQRNELLKFWVRV